MNIMNFAMRDVLTVAPSDRIDKAISMMEEHGVHHLVVAKDGRVAGMLSDRDILISTGWMLGIERTASEGDSRVAIVGPTRVQQIMSRPVFGVTQAGSARQAAQMMLDLKIGALPILRDDKIVAIVTETDLLRWLVELGFGNMPADRLLGRQARELMSPRIISVRPNVPIGEVIDTFRRFHIRHVPVAIKRQLLGIISDRDVRRVLGWSSVRDMQAQATGRMNEQETPNMAADIMHADVRTIAPFAQLREAVRLMLEHRIHSLPVVDAGELMGIVTQTDLVKAISSEEAL